MPRINVPDRGYGDHVDWMLARPEMAAGMGAFSEAVYGNTRLPLREREVARYRIAQINRCPVCLATRAKDAEIHGVTDALYEHLDEWATHPEYTERERLAAEFADGFGTDPTRLDDDLWTRLRGAFTDEEIVDLTICCGMWLGLGRMQAALGIHPSCEIRI